MEFKNAEDYNSIDLLDKLEIPDIKVSLINGTAKVKNISKGTEFEVSLDLTEKEREVIKAGGRLNYVKNNSK